MKIYLSHLQSWKSIPKLFYPGFLARESENLEKIQKRPKIEKTNWDFSTKKIDSHVLWSVGQKTLWDEWYFFVISVFFNVYEALFELKKNSDITKKKKNIKPYILGFLFKIFN